MNSRTPDFDRAVVPFAALGIVSPVFGPLAHSGKTNFVLVQHAGAYVMVVLGLIALVGALTHRSALVRVAGVGYAVAAVLQLVQFGRSTNWLDGNGSTFTLMAALALGLLVISLNRPSDRSGADSPVAARRPTPAA